MHPTDRPSEMHPTDRPSEEQYRAMLDRMEHLVAEFTESSQFESLTGHQKREAEFILENVGEFLAAYLDVPIDERGLLEDEGDWPLTSRSSKTKSSRPPWIRPIGEWPSH